MKHLYYVFKLLRPRQWVKNLALFAAITFGGQLFNYPILSRVLLGLVAFCLLSSATYIINDIFDLKKDRLHPFKKNRPLASGKVSVFEGLIIAFILIIVSLSVGIQLGPLFIAISIIYILMQIFYSLIFKGLAIFDILFIAAGYILRVLAGELISGFHISAWLLLTTISLSLFLAVGKRRSELTLLRDFSEAQIDEVRRSLSRYSERLLDAFTVMFATSTFILYSLFTFQEEAVKPTLSLLLPDFLPNSLNRKWLMITILPVVYGLMRYLQDIYEKNEGESPDRVLFSDKPLLANLCLWAFLVIFVIYFMNY